jgi:hypothetical protein
LGVSLPEAFNNPLQMSLDIMEHFILKSNPPLPVKKAMSEVRYLLQCKPFEFLNAVFPQPGRQKFELPKFVMDPLNEMLKAICKRPGLMAMQANTMGLNQVNQIENQDKQIEKQDKQADL